MRAAPPRRLPPAAATPPNAAAAAAAARAAHNAAQAAVFDAASAAAFAEKQPREIEEVRRKKRGGDRWPRVPARDDTNHPPFFFQRLARIAAAVPLDASSRVLDVGAGTGCLIPHLQARGVADYLAVDVSAPMLARLAADHAPSPSVLGNDPAIRTWVGDVESVPAYQGPADAIFFNAVFGNVADQASALTAAALLLRPGGYVVVSHPMGRPWHGRLREADPEIVPHALPDEGGWGDLLAGQPLTLASLQVRRNGG